MISFKVTELSPRSLLTCLLLLSSWLPSSFQQVPVINTTSGLLRGFSPYPDVHAYLGIPYAESPVGDLRFAPPQPFKTKDCSTRNCYDVSPGCFQLNYVTAFSDRSTGIAESEDSLTINIVSTRGRYKIRLIDTKKQWKPAEANKVLPVLIFLYGGGFASGANGLPEYSGVEFVSAQKDIIFASIKSATVSHSIL